MKKNYYIIPVSKLVSLDEEKLICGSPDEEIEEGGKEEPGEHGEAKENSWAFTGIFMGEE